MKLAFTKLTEQEILALAIAMEEEDGRIYGEFAARFREKYPATAGIFLRMQEEEATHRSRLAGICRRRFGDHIPLIRRQDIKGFLVRKPLWLSSVLPIEKARHEAELMELESQRFYQQAASRAADLPTRELLNELAREESTHAELAAALEQELGASGRKKEEDATARREFVLQIVQPGLAGLMDGSVSTLAPVFAAAFATKDSWYAFVVGLAASVGAGISMGFAEALSDDGALSGRGRPYVRGAVCGLMTTLGGIGHTIPFLIHDFRLAMAIAVAVVAIELAAIAWIRHRYMETALLPAMIQVVLGGILVFTAGVLIGTA
jgi:rubrerythrin